MKPSDYPDDRQRVYCAAYPCPARLPSKTLLCERHARMLPPELHTALSAIADPRNVFRAPPSPEVREQLETLARALEAVASQGQCPEWNQFRFRIQQLERADRIAAGDPRREHQAVGKGGA